MAKYDREPLPSSVEAFERYITNHHKVSKLEKIGQNLYLIHRYDKPPVKVVHSNIYVLSEADAIEYFSENNDIDAIVLAGNWNSYTYGAQKTLEVEIILEFLNLENFSEP